MKHRVITLFSVVMLLLAGSFSLAAGPAAASSNATLSITLRGCDEGVDPRAGSPASTCTTPLDAPDASAILWGGDGQGGMAIADLPRAYNGAYEISIPANTPIRIVSMDPSLRDAYFVPEIGFDAVAGMGGVAVITASPGETVSLHYYYYYNDVAQQSSATMSILFRACPEGFQASTMSDYETGCTIPLDAPDASVIFWGGDGQGGMAIADLPRAYNGAYLYDAGPNTMSVSLAHLEPVLRDDYMVFGYDAFQNGNPLTYDVSLQPGESRDILVVYWYE